MKRVIEKSEYLKNSLTMVSGASVVQLIPILISPLLTRIYTPEEFGAFGLFLAIGMVLGALATAMYENAILIPKKDVEAAQVVGLSLISNFILVSLLVGVLIFAHRFIVLIPDQGSQFMSWRFWVPVSIFLMGWHRTFYAWLNRMKLYKDLAIAQIWQTSTTAAMSLLLGWLTGDPNGLIYGYLCGQMIGLIRLGFPALKSRFHPLSALEGGAMLEQARRFSRFPKFNLPASFIQMGSSQVHILFLSQSFGSSPVGFLALTQRVVRLPMTVISRSVADVFKQKAVEELRETGSCRSLFVRTAKSLFLISILPFSALFAIAPDLFAWVFGPEWRTSGEFTRVLILMYFLQFTVNPLSMMFTIAEKQKHDLALQVYLITVTLTALFVGYNLSGDVKTTLLAFALAYSSKYLIEFLLAFSFTEKKTS